MVRHKKRRTKFYTFLLIPDNERSTKSMKLSARILKFLFIFLIVIIVSIILAAISYWNWAEVVIDYYSLREENLKLKDALAQVEEVQSDLNRLKKIDQKLRSSLSGYVSIVEGNLEEKESELVENLDPSESAHYDRSIFNSIPDIYPVNGFITREYQREGSLLSEAHIGIDIVGVKGSPVKATADGIIIFSGWTYEQGNVVIIKHKLNFYSFYKHNLRNLCHELEHVKKGQVIALLGDTGQISSGPHLHFEIWKGSKPVDPKKYLRKN